MIFSEYHCNVSQALLNAIAAMLIQFWRNAKAIWTQCFDSKEMFSIAKELSIVMLLTFEQCCELLSNAKNCWGMLNNTVLVFSMSIHFQNGIWPYRETILEMTTQRGRAKKRKWLHREAGRKNTTKPLPRSLRIASQA